MRLPGVNRADSLRHLPRSRSLRRLGRICSTALATSRARVCGGTVQVSAPSLHRKVNRLARGFALTLMRPSSLSSSMYSSFIPRVRMACSCAVPLHPGKPIRVQS